MLASSGGEKRAASSQTTSSVGDRGDRPPFRARSCRVVAIRTQVVFDAAEPHALAAFWADALHYEHEDIDAFVSGLVNAGHVPVEYTVEIDGKRRWRSVASLRHPDDPVDERGSSMGRRILFQAVPEPKTVKNRVHLDLLVGPEHHDSEVGRLQAWARPSSVSMTATRADGRCWSTRKATSSTSREATAGPACSILTSATWSRRVPSCFGRPATRLPAYSAGGAISARFAALGIHYPRAPVGGEVALELGHM